MIQINKICINNCNIICTIDLNENLKENNFNQYISIYSVIIYNRC